MDYDICPDGGRLRALLGETEEQRALPLFGTEYTIALFPRDRGGFTAIPVRYWPPSDASMIVDPKLAELLMMRYEIGQAFGDLQLLADHEFRPVRDHYNLDSWFNTEIQRATGLEIDSIDLFSKRKVQRYTIGHMSLWSAQEVFKAMHSGGVSVVGGTIGLLERLHDLGHFDEIDTDEERAQFRQEVQALIALQTATNGEYDALGPMAQLAGIGSDEFELLVKLLGSAEEIRGFGENLTHLNGIHEAVGSGDELLLAVHMDNLVTSIQNAATGMLIDASSDLAIEALGWEGVDEQIQSAAWLSDLHHEGISFAAQLLLDRIDRIQILEAGEDTPEARAELLEAYHDVMTLRCQILWPLIAEHYRVQLAHLSRVHESTNEATAWYLGASQDNLDGLAEDLDDAVDEARGAAGRYNTFLANHTVNKAVYEDIRHLVMNQYSDALLYVTPEPQNEASLGGTSRVGLSCLSEYFEDATIDAVGGGTGPDGITFSGGGEGITIPSNDRGSVYIDVTVPLDWFLQSNNYLVENQGFVTLDVPISWTVGGSEFTRKFPVPVIVVPTASWTDIVPERTVYRPGEQIDTQVCYEGGLGQGDAIAAWWLEPDGDAVGLSLGFPDNGCATLVEERSGPPYGSYGVRLRLNHIDPDLILIPDTVLNQMWFLVPPIVGDLGVLDPLEVGIVYAAEDKEFADSIIGAIGIDPTHAYVEGDHTLGELIQLAEQRDMILLGGNEANRLVAELRNQGRVSSPTPTTDGDAYTEVVEVAFGNSDAVIVAGYRKVDTDTATVGFLDAWDPDLSGCAVDLNQDGLVNTQDFLLYLNYWSGQDPIADWNDDGTVNTQDFLAYLNGWAAGC